MAILVTILVTIVVTILVTIVVTISVLTVDEVSWKELEELIYQHNGDWELEDRDPLGEGERGDLRRWC